MNREYQNDSGFLELIAEHRLKILKICRVYAWQRFDRDDLYQEILCQIWRALPSLREKAHAGTWLYRIALNTSVSFVRKHKSHRNRVVPFDEATIQEVPELSVSPDAQTEEQLSELFRAIARLNDTDKALVTLFLEELSYEQISSIMGISESNVGVMLHRIKKKLFTLMKEVPCMTTP